MVDTAAEIAIVFAKPVTEAPSAPAVDRLLADAASALGGQK